VNSLSGPPAAVSNGVQELALQIEPAATNGASHSLENPPPGNSRAATSRYSQLSRGSMAHQIRTLRRESRLTIEELAAEVGIAARTVQRHESGEVQEIRLRHIRDYERVFSSLLKHPVRLENAVAASQ
jgi:DNA-binding XRE family transcriptional regulator